FASLGLFYVRRWLVWPDGFGFLRDLFPYAVPYGVICSISAFVPTIERSLVNNFLGSHELGLYAASAKVAMLTVLVSSAFQTAWGPFALAIHKEADAAHTYNWALKGFAFGMCAFVLFLAAIAEPLISLLASDRYARASIIVFPLAMGLAIQATGWITEIGIDLSKRSYLSLYGYTAFLCTTALSIYAFATAFGLLGIACGVMLGQRGKSL